jgi:hypothetical protein
MFSLAGGDVMKLKLPTSTSLEGPRRDRGTIRVSPAGKPPKLRWKPGSKVRYKGDLYEVMYCYRIESDPHEWQVCLEEVVAPDEIARALDGLGAGSTTPRIVYEIFRDWYEASSYFMDIPANGDRHHVTNKQMLQDAVPVP